MYLTGGDVVTLNILPAPAGGVSIEDALKNLEETVDKVALNITLPDGGTIVKVDPDSFETVFELVTPLNGKFDARTKLF